MRRQMRIEAAQQVADRLFAAEVAIDAALTAAAELNAVIPVARTRANISAVVGQCAVESAAGTLSALVNARRYIVDTHNRLKETQDQIGLRTVSFGGGTDKPPPADAQLRVVEKEAA